jgi:NADH-quinone oxidoreductase subunit G
LNAAGITEDQLKKVRIISIATHETATTKAANVVLAGLTVFEKSGSYINQQFRLQKSLKALPGPDRAVDDWVLLATLVARRTGERAPSTIEAVWETIESGIPQLKGVTFGSIPETGRVIDGSAFENLPFIEEETLHFKPVVTATARI